jgi:hypothetical protein
VATEDPYALAGGGTDDAAAAAAGRDDPAPIGTERCPSHPGEVQTENMSGRPVRTSQVRASWSMLAVSSRFNNDGAVRPPARNQVSIVRDSETECRPRGYERAKAADIRSNTGVGRVSFTIDNG